MKLRPVAFALTNFSAVLVLAALIASPFYFAKNFTKIESVADIEQSRNIAGAKTSKPYILISQAEKFSNLNFYQDSEKYRIDFAKTAPQQAFLGVLAITNPTDTAKRYYLEVSEGQTKVFFGENLEDQKSTATIPPNGSIPVSIFSPQEASAASQTVEFTVDILK